MGRVWLPTLPSCKRRELVWCIGVASYRRVPQKIAAEAVGPEVTEGSGGETASGRVLAALAARIATGEYAVGARLGVERALAAEFGVPRSAVRVALGRLEEDGVVRRVRGRNGGAYVSDRRVERDLTSIVGLPHLLKAQGMIAGTRVIRAAITEAAGLVAGSLHLAPGELVFQILRIRLANGAPISLESAHFPVERFPGLLEQPLGGSLYDVLAESYQVKAFEATERIGVHLADPDEALILEVEPGSPLFEVCRVTVDPEGQAFEYSIDLFRSDRTLIYVRSFGRGG